MCLYFLTFILHENRSLNCVIIYKFIAVELRMFLYYFSFYIDFVYKEVYDPASKQ